MTGRRRRELADSFRLLATDERWFLTDFLVGVAAFVVWVAGTGALVTQVGDAAGVTVGLGRGGSPAPTAVATFAVLWLVLPALAVLVRLRRRICNLRGNVDQCYRLDHPAALLVPPGVLLAVAVSAVVLRPIPALATLVLVPVGLFALVRTLAFSYRVYSFSHPLLVQAGVVAATAVALAGAIAVVGTATGQGPLLEAVVTATGGSPTLLGTVSVGRLAVETPVLALLAPAGVAAAYVAAQTVVALFVRVVRPPVHRSKMRSGQRYPPFLETAPPARTGSSDSAGAGTGAGANADASDSGIHGGTGAAATDADADAADGEDADGDGVVDADPGDSTDDLDDVSNTRVFTPPADAGDGSFGASPDAGRGDASDSADDENDRVASSRDGADTGDETRTVPAREDDGGDAGQAARERCDACGQSFAVDAAVRFCPNCGAALDAE